MKRIFLTFVFLFSFCLFVEAKEVVSIAPLTISIKSTSVTVAATATAIPATGLAGRESVAIVNVDSATKTVFIGASDVTTANGIPLSSTTPSISLDLDDSVTIYGIVASGTADVRILEAK